MRHFEYRIEAPGAKKRLDVYLSEIQKEISRSRIKKLIEENRVTVNGAPARAKYKLKAGDRVRLEIPAPAPLEIAAEPIPLDIIYEDECMVVVDKPAGMVVHPAPGHATGTLVNALLAHCTDLSGIGGVERPGIVHRLDKDTSGLVLVAKTQAAHNSLARQFKRREIKKVYLALVKGRVRRDRGLIDRSIGRHKLHRKKMAPDIPTGRDAQTGYEVIRRFEHFTFLRLYPKTGRTHQIRVHVACMGHPILGDALYGGKVDGKRKKIARQALHAHRLELSHPLTNAKMVFESPVPEDMMDYLESY